MVKEAPKPADVFDYEDHHTYLKDWFAAAKLGRPAISFRLFSKLAGLKSPNFLKLVMDGDRNLSLDGIQKFSVALKHNKMEQEYFKNLVLYNQANNSDEKLAAYTRMTKSRKFARVKPVVKDEFDLYSAWYHPVIREMIESNEWNGTPEWFSRNLAMPISPQQAQKSIELLDRLGFIAKNDDGKWRQSTPVVTTGSEATSLILLKYHQDLLRLTANLLPEVEAQDRDISTLTIGITRKRLPELKRMVQEFRQEIIKVFSTEVPPEEAVLLNIQMIPVTKSRGALK